MFRHLSFVICHSSFALTALTVLIVFLLFAQAASALKYNGTKLTEDTSFSMTQSGTIDKDDLTEVSGLACSRVTPGYLWAVWDEGNTQVAAISPDGTLAMRLNLTGTGSRDDWEDICTGTYQGTHYLFIGAMGDNDLAYAGNYQIHYLPEPAISGSSATAAVSTITFSFPGDSAHNVETLMYDSVDHMFYIVDKAEDVAPTLYSLPFRTDYSGTQTLTRVCQLGTDGEKFELATGGDITPDGSMMAIKSVKYILLWTRQGSESLAATAARRPVLIGNYDKDTEDQGESIAWKDDYTFYVTSDSKKDVPVYQYARPVPDQPTALDENENSAGSVSVKVFRDGALFIRKGGATYTADGRRVE